MVSKKGRKKMFSTSRKISCPLGRMSCFSQNCFLLIPIMVSSSSKIALTKNTVSTRQKISSFFENRFPPIPVMVSTSQKYLRSKFPQDRILDFNDPSFRLVKTDFLASGNVFFCSEFFL